MACPSSDMHGGCPFFVLLIRVTSFLYQIAHDSNMTANDCFVESSLIGLVGSFKISFRLD
eukprot:CAMPEP_0171638104 /NCGR_PEP_ID=MMETSP0990-20121206/28696_1 /TAXON_ID=483369 /ORGANISM="non described non described, Strain CCMP2098" /LENGTH=59 /DNA_ID=CAMNT_0012211141 /DNA_START=268 /DNA_END=447 /DNA_ORIENTATION=-